MATYYVDGAVGNDSNAGTSEGAGNAWLTIDHAADTIAAGDQVWIKASADYTEKVTATSGGSTNAWKVFSGYSSVIGDGGKATIDASGETNGYSGPSFSDAYHRWENIIVENASSHGWLLGPSGYITFINCEANNNGGCGFASDNNDTRYESCISSGNSSFGYTSSPLPNVAVSCISTGNAGYGFYGTYGQTIVGCVSVSNSGDAIYGAACVIGCTVDGDGKDTDSGINWSAHPGVAANNIIYDCTTGIGAPNSGWRGGSAFNNLLYSNTTNFSNVTDEHDNITASAPGFTDEAGGDYTLAAGSAARNAGADASGTSSPGMDIGAHQSADAGGGGSRVIITG